MSRSPAGPAPRRGARQRRRLRHRQRPRLRPQRAAPPVARGVRGALRGAAATDRARAGRCAEVAAGRAPMSGRPRRRRAAPATTASRSHTIGARPAAAEVATGPWLRSTPSRGRGADVRAGRHARSVSSRPLWCRCAPTWSAAGSWSALRATAATAGLRGAGAARVVRRPGRARPRPGPGHRGPGRAGGDLRPRADRPRPARPGDPAAVRDRPAAAGRRARDAISPEVGGPHRPGRRRPRPDHQGHPRHDLRAAARDREPVPACRPPQPGPGVRAAARASAPTVRTVGPVDTAVPAEVRDQLLPVLREALSNLARHAARRPRPRSS